MDAAQASQVQIGGSQPLMSNSLPFCGEGLAFGQAQLFGQLLHVVAQRAMQEALPRAVEAMHAHMLRQQTAFSSHRCPASARRSTTARRFCVVISGASR
jgi:hypothetical protein